MNKRISKSEIEKNELFFWYSYLSCFRGYDEEKELNLDDVLQEIFEIDEQEFNKWYKEFYFQNSVNFISGQLNKSISFHIEIYKEEITYFLNDIYIGNLSGHFECWSLRLEEIRKFEEFDFVFLLLLPMLGITKEEFNITKKLIKRNLENLENFKSNSDYIAKCITNGLMMENKFYTEENIGFVNKQNHSVRNIKKYPQNKEDIIKLNELMNNFD